MASSETARSERMSVREHIREGQVIPAHPLALTVDPSGDLLVADWGRGVIYAIRSP